MTGKPTIFVSGLGRCGSSMTMQMLSAAGIQCVGDFPSFETWETNATVISNEWLAKHSGHAAKMLDPHRCRIPDNANCVIIWLDRDAEQQAKSQCKMISLLGGVNVSGAWRGMRSQIKKDRRKCLKIMGQHPVMLLRFEDALTDPLSFSREISGYLSPWFDIGERVYAMARTVINRDGSCATDLSIEAALIFEAERKTREEARS